MGPKPNSPRESLTICKNSLFLIKNQINISEHFEIVLPQLEKIFTLTIETLLHCLQYFLLCYNNRIKGQWKKKNLSIRTEFQTTLRGSNVLQP